MFGDVEGRRDGRRPLLDIFEGILKLLMAATVFAMMALTAVDVAARYVFSAPLDGAFEIVTMLLAASIFLGLPLVTRQYGHITVDLLDRRFRGRARHVQQIAIQLFSALLMGVIAVRMWHQGDLMAKAGHVTGFLEWPTAPVAYGMAILCGVTVLVHAGLIWSLATRGPIQPSARQPTEA